MNSFNSILKSFTNVVPVIKYFHTSHSLLAWAGNYRTPKKWLQYNKVIYPPQKPDEERRPASKKMWYVACMVRGLTVDDAIKQLKFVLKKGGVPIMETILEAKELAVLNHNVEFGSNLWIAESFVGKGRVFKGIRRHARARIGEVEYKHCHYFVRLEEGLPPKDYYYYRRSKEPEEQLDEWLEQMRKRKVTSSL